MTTNNDPNAIDKTWELTLYEQNRQPQPIITDNTEIGVSPRSLHSELMCPICLEILKRTMTTKECLHRFCHDCIITALRSGNKECPTCRKKLVSKRSLRFDPNFDAIISKIYPSREDYEAQQERVMEKLGKQHNFSANIEETLRRQAANRARSGKKLADNDEENALAAATASAAALTIHDENDVELVIKPLLHDKKLDRSLNTVRYLKITEQATVEHICKFLEMRYEFEHEGSSEEVKGSFDSISASEKQQQPRLLFHSSSLNLPSTSSTEGSAAASGDLFSSASTSKKTSYPFSIFIATGPSQFNPLPSDCSLTVVMDKYWKMDRPLELFFAYKMASTKKAETTPGASTKW